MSQLSNVCGASPVNNQIIFFDGRDTHFDDCTLIHMEHRNIQPFILKLGNYVKYQPNDNRPDAKLKYLYNEMKYSWMLKYGTTKMLPHHTKSILVEAWCAFKVSAGKVISDSCVKTKLPPVSPPEFDTNT